MKFDGVIFDWAGTTVDYGSFAPVKAFIDAFDFFGITPTPDEVRKPMGMLKIDHIRAMLSMERISNIWQEKYGKSWTEEDVAGVYELSEKRILETVSRFADPKPYVVETVNTLREMGLKIGSTTGYTDEMMRLVLPNAKAAGYEPDCWFSPDSVDKCGRPYPFMIFKNMQKLRFSNVSRVIKVGDTISDIKEGKNAGVVSVGVIEGSSVMGLTQQEYEALSEEQKQYVCKKTADTFLAAGADYVIKDIRGILDLVK